MSVIASFATVFGSWLHLAAETSSVPDLLRAGPLFALMAGPPLAAWVVLAAQRAWRADPLRATKSARRALRRLARQFRANSVPPSARDLVRWQELVRGAWSIEMAAPDAAMIGARAGEVWSILWIEVETALYSPDPALPPDWPARACSAAEAMPRLGPFPWPNRSAHWLPATFLVCVVLSVSARASGPALIVPTISDWRWHAADATAATARNEWNLAAAHWTAAYLLAPGDPTVTAAMGNALRRVQVGDPLLDRLANGAWYDRVAGSRTPVQWERLGWRAALATALALLTSLGLWYHGRSRWPIALMLAVAAAGLLGAAISYLAEQHYGLLADPQAAFVTQPAEIRALPSDSLAQGQSATLLSGTIVVVDASFLDWDHVTTTRGTRGWIRAQDEIWLYRTRPGDAFNARYATNAGE